MPTAFVLGAAKSATTTLCALLDAHPALCVSRPKEPAAFLSDLKSTELVGRYEQCFAECSDAAVHRIDGSTAYTGMIDDGCAARIHAAVPDARLIYIVREPIERIESHWVQLCASSSQPTVPRLFVEAVLRVPELVEASRYWEQIRPYRARFDPSQILVLFVEDLVRDQTAVALRCQEFLGVDLVAPPGPVVEKRRSDNRQEPALLRRVRQSRFLGQVNEATRRFSMLRELKRTIRRSTLRPIPEPRWNRRTLEDVVEILRFDLEVFGREYGPLPPNWGWLLEPEAARERVNELTG
jgi:hypothetical protein